MNSNPIGVFDSGIGGLTVAKEILAQLPNEKIIYLGDTARVPYGTRGKEVIKKFALELTNFLLGKKVKFLVVACNTMSATCLEEIEKISTVPVLGVIKDAAVQAAKESKTNVIGVIGTPATISSKVYEKFIKKANPKARIVSQACPLLVPLAEEGLINEKATELITENYLKKLKKTNMDVLILGCTHYPILRKVIQKIVGPKVKLINTANLTVFKLKELLKNKDLENNNRNGRNEFLVTDSPERVYKVAKTFLGQNLDGKLKKVIL